MWDKSKRIRKGCWKTAKLFKVYIHFKPCGTGNYIMSIIKWTHLYCKEQLVHTLSQCFDFELIDLKLRQLPERKKFDGNVNLVHWGSVGELATSSEPKKDGSRFS